MSEIDESATTEVESQAADIQEETAAQETTEQQADETQVEDTEETSDETSEDSTDTTATEGEETKTEAPAKSKEDYIRERLERKALRDAQSTFTKDTEARLAELDTDDAAQRLEALELRDQIRENERFIEKVEVNIQTARRDVQDAQNLPVFKEDPELFVEVMRDVADTYGVWHDELKEADGSPVFLGFYNPKTGAPISVLNVAQREAAKLSKVADRVKTTTQVKASQDEAKMRARSDTPGGGKNTVDSTGDSQLSAEDYAKKYNLGRVRV